MHGPLEVHLEEAGPDGPERSGRIPHGLERAGRWALDPPLRGSHHVPPNPTPGRSLVTRQAVLDIIRAAALGSYGVTGFASGPLERLLGRLGLGQPGIGLRLDAGLEVELDLTVARGVPVAEVARQVDSAVRYAIRRGLGREVARISIHVDGLRVSHGGAPPTILTADPSAIGPRDLADSGTDVA